LSVEGLKLGKGNLIDKRLSVNHIMMKYFRLFSKWEIAANFVKFTIKIILEK